MRVVGFKGEYTHGRFSLYHALGQYSSWVVVSHLFSFHPLPGEDSQFEEYFSNGLKPPAIGECYLSLILVIFLPRFSWLLPLCTHLSHMCHKDIAWSDLLTEAVYSTHLREKPDQGTQLLRMQPVFCGGIFASKCQVFPWPNHGGVEDVDRDCMRLLTLDQLGFPLNWTWKFLQECEKSIYRFVSCSSQQFDMKCFCFLFWYLFAHMGVSENSGTPKSSILIGFSIINHPFWGTPIFGNTPYHVTVSWQYQIFLRQKKRESRSTQKLRFDQLHLGRWTSWSWFPFGVTGFGGCGSGRKGHPMFIYIEGFDKCYIDVCDCTWVR